MASEILTRLRAGIQEDREVIRAKQKILKELKRLPDDESRERVLRTALAFYGWPARD